MVLSKLRHANAASKLGADEKNDLATGLQATLGASLAGLRPLNGGTLGIIFSGTLDGCERCFKTHAVPSGQVTLRREHAFLQQISNNRTDASLFSVAERDSQRTWLQMNLLSSCNDLTPATIRRLVFDYEAKLPGKIGFALVPAEDNIHLLLDKSEQSLALLSDHDLISAGVASKARHRLTHLRAISGEFILQLCHGDLGPANILCDDFGPVAIDWEDAFWGIAGYDYLYWLTFFSNRRWLTPDSVGHTPWGRPAEVALMVMILLLKCMLSVRDGSYLGNKISFDQRLMEVIALD
ncbi:phosphotransferase [Neorhizobium sp. JUb45]|uniref:phosphotransferase n=1 Tax=Neorhizobium sp. JUb45 TaxID=2485113 RepID=UPI00104BB3A9|nr:phosphotransferase [Neorhizobium sp. JUb45]TCR03919.1 phosphotransferase family enzyme [Neorhizobium sp. JUb45]